ncbi:hypothetical protein FRC07_003771, partial [Ceratobasidium sp. 392]
QESYLYPVANDIHTDFAPKPNSRYLTSNVNITVVDKKTNSSVSVPLGNRFAKFKPKQRRKATVFGVLFGFTGNTVNTIVQKNTTTPIGFSRRNSDVNLYAYKFHSGTLKKGFNTRLGKKITRGMHELAVKWNLTKVWGTAPQNFYLNCVEYPGSSSLVSLFADQVIPKALNTASPARATIPRVPVLDMGSQRFDVYSGPFTRNDQFIVSPFMNVVQYLPGVPASIATRVTGRLNDKTAARRSLEEEKDYERGEFMHRYSKWRREQHESYEFTKRDA